MHCDSGTQWDVLYPLNWCVIVVTVTCLKCAYKLLLSKAVLTEFNDSQKSSTGEVQLFFTWALIATLNLAEYLVMM